MNELLQLETVIGSTKQNLQLLLALNEVAVQSLTYSEGEEAVKQSLLEYVELESSYSNAVKKPSPQLHQIANISDRMKTSFRDLCRLQVRHPALFKQLIEFNGEESLVQSRRDDEAQFSDKEEKEETEIETETENDAMADNVSVGERPIDAQEGADNGNINSNTNNNRQAGSANVSTNNWSRASNTILDYCTISLQNLRNILLRKSAGESVLPELDVPPNSLNPISGDEGGVKRRAQELQILQEHLMKKFETLASDSERARQLQSIQIAAAQTHLHKLQEAIAQHDKAVERNKGLLESNRNSQIERMRRDHETQINQHKQQIRELEVKLTTTREEHTQIEEGLKKRLKTLEKQVETKISIYDDDMIASTSRLEVLNNLHNNESTRLEELISNTERLVDDRLYYEKAVLSERIREKFKNCKHFEAIALLHSAFEGWKALQKQKHSKKRKKSKPKSAKSKT